MITGTSLDNKLTPGHLASPLMASILLALLLTLTSTSALAQSQSDASVGLLLETKEARCNRVTLKSCESNNLKIAGELYTPYYAYLTIFKGEASVGLAGLELGIRYQNVSNQGVDVFGWTACSDLEFPNASWPGSGSSNRITWNPDANCQLTEPGGAGDGVTAVAGYFYVIAYSDDVLKVDNGTWGDGSRISVADCNAAETRVPLDRAGSVAFSSSGDVPGSLPCGRLQEDTTFGKVKSTYNR